jgi:hypothetical protein
VSKQRQKGTDFENIVVEAVQRRYPDAHRNPPAGSKDIGDVWTGDDRFILEAKCVARMALPEWVAEAKVEAARVSPHTIGVVVHKRKGTRDPDKQWVTMELGDFLDFARASE